MVVAEALDSLIDVFSDDALHPVFQRLELLPHLQQACRDLKSKVSRRDCPRVSIVRIIARVRHGAVATVACTLSRVQVRGKHATVNEDAAARALDVLENLDMFIQYKVSWQA